MASFGGGASAPRLTFVPVRKHTYLSDVNLSRLPRTTTGVELAEDRYRGHGRRGEDRIRRSYWRVLSRGVTFEKYGRYRSVDGKGVDDVSGILTAIHANLLHFPLSGFVAEGMSPYGLMSPPVDDALALATYSGMPVVRVGRGNTGGDTPRRDPISISGSNLTATKARLLLMASLLKLGGTAAGSRPSPPD